MLEVSELTFSLSLSLFWPQFSTKTQFPSLTESALMNTNACGQLFIWQLYNIMDLLSVKEFYFLQAGIRVH